MLLSADLLPHLLGSLELEDGGAAAVCTAWRRAWDAKPLRRLTRFPEGFSDKVGVASLEAALQRGRLGWCHRGLEVRGAKVAAYILLASTELKDIT